MRDLPLRIRFIAAIACGLLGALASPPTHADAPAVWTILFYMDADNDLEAPQMQDLREMLQVGSSDAVQIIVLADRHPGDSGKYTNSAVANLPNWTSAKLLRVQRGQLEELTDWGEVDMGDPAVLSRFLSTAIKQFPAQHYALVFGDHGMAWPGLAVDESSGNDTLTLLELSSALQDAPVPGGKFDLIGFDACVMANLEVADAVAPFSRYLVGSEEIEPAEGWNYASLLAAVTEAPPADGAALGRTIVDSYKASFSGNASNGKDDEQAKGITLSVIDLGRLGPLDQAVAALGTAAAGHIAQAGRAGWLNLARARDDAESYGRSATTRPGVEVYDLLDIANKISAQSNDAPLRTASAAVAAAVKRAVIYQTRGAARPQASGISIFFPADQATLTARTETSYDETAFAQRNRWYPFLTAFANSEARDTQPPQLGDVQRSEVREGGDTQSRFASTLHADDIETASFSLAVLQQGKRVIIGSIPMEPDDSGQLTEDWDGEWFALSDRDNQFICPITDFEELDSEQDLYWAAVPAQLKLAGTGAWLDVTLNFLLDFNDEAVSGEFVYAVEQSAHGPREIDLGVNDLIRPVFIAIDADGRETQVVSQDPKQVIKIDDLADLHVGRSEVPTGSYQLGFVVRDLAGNTSQEFVPVEVP